jgi:endogenous inhibitor of DNA gyrase (YacG/DUF329 family)
MRCPTCEKEVAFDAPFMPFCSDRCRMLDLGKWAAEEYRISTPITPSPAPIDEADEHEGRE